MRPPVQHIDVPPRRFSHVHVDLVGPLPSVRGYTHVFTVVDRSTRLPAAYPIQETSTRACIDSLMEWISCFGVPATVTSDQGSQFTSSSWSAFCGSLGIQHVMMTAYHPQFNGMVERMHQWLKAAIVACHSSTSWPSELPWHASDPPWKIPVSARGPTDRVSRQPPLPHGSLHSADFGARSITSLWTHAFAACTLGSGVHVYLPRRGSSFPHTFV